MESMGIKHDTQNVNRILDKELKENSPRFEEKPDDDKARAGPPTLDEWADFFSHIVFLSLAEWYVSFCFRGVPEEIIDQADLERCRLSRDERRAMAVPMAELANKSKITRKHGRQVIAFFETFESFILIGIWAAKVHRIAGKYRPKKEKREKVKKSERVQQDASNGQGGGSGGGIVIPGVTVANPGLG